MYRQVEDVDQLRFQECLGQLPMAEDDQLRENAGFWKLIEEGEQRKK